MKNIIITGAYFWGNFIKIESQTFEWNLILTVLYTIGSFVSTIPAGFLAEWYGGKTLITVALITCTVFSALTQLMCELSFYAMQINRIMIGVAGVSC